MNNVIQEAIVINRIAARRVASSMEIQLASISKNIE